MIAGQVGPASILLPPTVPIEIPIATGLSSAHNDEHH